MKKRLTNKILKRSGIKLHNKVQLTSLEQNVFDRVAESKLSSALCKFRNDEWDAGTIYKEGFLERMEDVYKRTATIENLTGVKVNSAGKVLKWSNGKEWGEIHHPQLGRVMTYWKEGSPCYDTYTAPRVDEDGNVTSWRFCQDEGMWVDEIFIGEYQGQETASFS